jgi:hypothetical protein
LHTSLAPAECRRRVREAIDSEGWQGLSLTVFTGSKPVIGRVDGSSLRLRKRIWYGGVILIGGGLLASAFGAASGPEPGDRSLLLFLPTMLAFGYGLVRFGRHLARDEARFLAEFLARTVEARELGQSVQQGSRRNSRNDHSTN